MENKQGRTETRFRPAFFVSIQGTGRISLSFFLLLKNVITRKDIAEQAGVSVSVVSRALNNSGYVDPEKKKRILKLAQELGYNREPAALKGLRRRNRLIAYVYIAPFYILFLVFNLFPMAAGFLLSFFRWDGLSDMHFIGVQNYGNLLKLPAYGTLVLEI